MKQDSVAPPTRERIRAIAAELYVLRGYHGFSFGDIAEAIATTRANIHHHYGNKQRLMAELIDEFVADAERRIVEHWTKGDLSFQRRLSRQVEDLRTFYRRFNKAPGDRNVWSPLSRLRLDLPVLGDLAAPALEHVDRVYDAALRQAIARAIAAGELARATPVDDVARVLRLALLSCAPITQDSGRFTEIERLFGALSRTIMAAWGGKGGGRELRVRKPG